MKLSAVLMVKNEEAIIETALESVKDFDEIVIVDTGSTDRTKEIAARYTDKIFDFPWMDDFAAARNAAIEHATGDWIYSIDADQKLLTPVEQVRSECERADAAGVKSAMVNTLTAAGHTHWREVLFKNDPEIRWVGAVHEHLSKVSGFKVNVERFRGSSDSKKADPKRNLRILEKSEKTPRTLFYLGRECFEHRMYHDAIGWLLQYEGTWSPERAEAFLTLARCYWMTQQGDKARAACLRAIAVNPAFKEALQFMSQMHYEPMKSKWARLADAADSSDVLFKRV